MPPVQRKKSAVYYSDSVSHVIFPLHLIIHRLLEQCVRAALKSV